MDTPTPPQPDFPPPLPPTPPEPKKNRTNAIIIGSAAAVIAAIVATGVVVANSRDDSSDTAAAESSAPVDDTITAAEEPSPTPEETGPEIVALSDGVRWDGGMEVTLDDFTRGVSSEWAAPENTPYVKFTVRFKNGGDTTTDLSGSYVTCLYGDDGAEGEQIFDSEKSIDGLPEVHLRPGKSVSAKIGCELPKAEKYLQVELVPDIESETAIFAGNVK
ncbi:DUF4352 domain-containing protein [Streptomyces sp. NPDC057837]|uniref:DUF4352 domain-containing protein n=1 Tax=Streptomyces sp. NPDC057837 TaxID=3346260 RepID=UPI003688B51A